MHPSSVGQSRVRSEAPAYPASRPYSSAVAAAAVHEAHWHACSFERGRAAGRSHYCHNSFGLGITAGNKEVHSH